MSNLIAYVDRSVDLKFLSEKLRLTKKLFKIANELENTVYSKKYKYKVYLKI